MFMKSGKTQKILALHHNQSKGSKNMVAVDDICFMSTLYFLMNRIPIC